MQATSENALDAEVEEFVATLAARLKEAGLKLTAQRLSIVRCLAGDATHPTAQELFERLKPAFPTMSFATVYNTIAALTSIAAIVPVQFGGAARFDPNVVPHDHFVCAGCACVRDVPCATAEHMASISDVSEVHLLTSQSEAVEIHRVERIYRGLCASCRAARDESRS